MSAGPAARRIDLLHVIITVLQDHGHDDELVDAGVDRAGGRRQFG